MDEDTVEVFLPDPDDCCERLRRARAGVTVSCVYCDESEPVIKKSMTEKDAQQYWCKECETYFNLTFDTQTSRRSLFSTQP